MPLGIIRQIFDRNSKENVDVVRALIFYPLDIFVPLFQRFISAVSCLGHLPATTINYVRNYGLHDDYMYNIIWWGNGYCTGLPYILIVQMSASRRLRLNFYLFLLIHLRTESDRRKYQIMELRTKRSGCGIVLCFHVLQVLL